MRPSTLLSLPGFLAGALLAAPAGAQAQAQTGTRDGGRGSVQGTVRDSLAGRMLASALVQLVPASGAGAAHTAVADAGGRFSFEGLPAGRYLVGFLHPMLDSLGVEAPVRAVTVANDAAARIELAIPGARRLRAAICEGSTSGAVLVGFVRPARPGADVSGVTVAAEWSELSVGSQGIVRRTPRRVTTTRENGWFALCNVPGPGTMFVVASRGADSTDIVETSVPAEGLLRKDLFLGAARRVVVRDSTMPGDSTPRTRRVLSGDGRLTGRVVHAEGGTPLRGAQVGIVDGPTARTDERGEFTLVGLPEGTRTLDVRAVGFYPERRAVNVVEGARAGTIALATLRSVLDTMKIRASRTRVDNMRGFQDRMFRGQGRYITSVDIERRMVQVTTDIFRNQPGVKLEGDSLLVRGIGGYGELYCSPAIFLNGRSMRGVGGSDINLMVTPREIQGIEIYAATQVPGEFSDGLSGCGSIVIWTR